MKTASAAQRIFRNFEEFASQSRADQIIDQTIEEMLDEAFPAEPAAAGLLVESEGEVLRFPGLIPG